MNLQNVTDITDGELGWDKSKVSNLGVRYLLPVLSKSKPYIQHKSFFNEFVAKGQCKAKKCINTVLCPSFFETDVISKIYMKEWEF